MIRQLGTLGFFIKFNDSASAALKFVEIFSSSAATTSLFSASTSSARVVSTSVPATLYLNGASATALSDDEWNHITFTFNPKLQTSMSNNFLVRFGDLSKGDFNVHNLYITDYFMMPNIVQSTHKAFVGKDILVTASTATSSAIVMVSDKNEELHSSSVTGTVYQPFIENTKFIGDINLATRTSLSAYVSALNMTGDLLFHDGIRLQPGELILSFADNNIYQLSTTSNNLVPVSTSNGNYVNILSGIEFKKRCFVKTSGTFVEFRPLEKMLFMSTGFS